MYYFFFYMYLSFSALAAIISISMWFDYFRKIDVFATEKISHLLIALFVGSFTPFLSIYFYKLIGLVGFNLTGDFYNDLLYSVFAIGANEELTKLLGVVIVFKLLKKQINEPIDYLIYAGVTALGFSIVENYKYFNNYGIQIISTRAFYSALVHIINTSVIVYGFYRLKLFKKGNQILNTSFAFFISISTHGLFDFFLLNNFLGEFTSLLSTIVYLVGINMWAQMLNNANNYSSLFNYEKIHFSRNIFYRLLIWYAITLLLTIIYNVIVFNVERATNYFINSLSTHGLLLVIVIIRASRFRIFKRRYFKVKIGLPFYITKNQDEDFKFLYLIPIKIRGESPYEYQLTTYLYKKIELHALTDEPSTFDYPISVKLTHKVFLNDDVIVYKASSPSAVYYLKPKTCDGTETEEGHPISGLYKLDSEKYAREPRKIKFSDLSFLGWIYVK